MASVLDQLLAQEMESMIREKLGEKTCKKIKDHLHQRYDLSFAESIKDFYTLDATLREFFASGADAIEEDFRNRLISINAPAKRRPWITIDNRKLAKLIARAYGDKENRLILEVALRQPLVIPNMLEILGISKSSGYRLINKLVEDGLLTEQGYVEGSDGEKVSKYTALFERVKMELDMKILIVQVLLKENILKESQIIRVLLRGKLGVA